MTIADVWNKGKGVVSRNYILILLPLVLDLVLYGRLMFSGKNAFHIKMTIPSALPSIQNLLPDSLGFSASTTSGLTGFTGPGIIVSLVIIPWLTAGYLGTIVQDIKKPEYRLSFLQIAARFAVRLIFVQLIMIAVMLVISPLFFVPLLGGLVMMALIVLLFLLFFWEYSIVYDDINVISAAQKSYTTFTRNFGTMFSVLIPVVLVLAPLTAITSYLMDSPAFALLIFAYAYIGAVLVSGFMHLYAHLNETGSITPEQASVPLE